MKNMKMDTQQIENNIQRIRVVADKSPSYNKDINQHIESCKISMTIINQQKDIIKTLRSMLMLRDEQIRQLEERTLILQAKNKEIIEKQNILANELLKSKKDKK